MKFCADVRLMRRWTWSRVADDVCDSGASARINCKASLMFEFEDEDFALHCLGNCREFRIA